MMCRSAGVVCVVTLLLGGCASAGLVGSSHVVIMRTSSGEIRGGSYSLIRASDWQRGRLRGTPLGRADLDRQTGALRFALSFPEAASAEQPICLMIVGPTGPLAVRPRASGKAMYEFRNPLWEREMWRMAAVKKSEGEARALLDEERAARARVEQTLHALGGFEARSPDECREGPPVAPPERPVEAVPEPERFLSASQVCAVAWEQRLGADAARLYAAIERSGPWEERAMGEELQQRLPVHIAADPGELFALKLALRDGERFMLYDDALAFFRTKTAGCDAAVIQRFAQETERWEVQRAAAEAAPRRALEKCRGLAASYRQANLDLETMESKLSHAESEVDRLRAAAPKEIESVSLGSYSCQ